MDFFSVSDENDVRVVYKSIILLAGSRFCSSSSQ